MPVTAAQLGGFLDWLRDGGSGYEAGDQQYMAAQRLTETLAARGEWPAESEAWRTLLAPVLSSSPAQQQRLYELLEQWFAAPVMPQSGPEAGPGPLRKKARRPIPRDAWLYGSLCLVLMGALVAGAIHYWPARHVNALPPAAHVDTSGGAVRVDLPTGPVTLTVKGPDGKPLAGATVQYAGVGVGTTANGVVALDAAGSGASRYVVVSKAGYRPAVVNFPVADTQVTLTQAAAPQVPRHQDRWWIRHAQALRIVVLLAPGVLLLLWLIRLFRKALELRKWATTSEPRMRRIATSNKSEPLYPAADIRRLAVALRRRRPEESPELDLNSTVETTCRQAGYFSPVFATRNSEPEYLFLGERKNLRDHQARMQDELIRRLRDHDVYVQRYYFQSTPSTCSDANGDVYSLNDLAAMHPDNEVWLALDAARCVDPVSGMPEKWWASFSHWQYRTLLSFTRAEVDAELRISDPTRKGIEDLVLEMAQPAKEPPYPSVLRDSPDSWLTRIEPPPAAIARLNAQLQMFLGANGYLLLQATAVYPEIAWNITATLAGVLVPAGEREVVLNRLASLPWFRHGMMPDWLRVRLLSRLGANEERVRGAVRKYLDTPVDSAPQKEEALEIVPGAPRRGSARGALRDNVYLAFASGRKLDQLSVQAPKGWRKFLRDSVWLRVGVALAVMAAIWVVTNRVMDRLVQASQAHLKRPASAAPADALVSAMMQVAEAKEGSMKTPSGLANVQAYAEVASDVLGVADPLKGVTAAELKGRAVAAGTALAPGMAIETAGGFELAKAVVGDEVLTYGAADYVPRGEIVAAYDLSGMQMGAPVQQETAAGQPGVSSFEEMARRLQEQQRQYEAYMARIMAGGNGAPSAPTGLSASVLPGGASDLPSLLKSCDAGTASACTTVGELYASGGAGLTQDYAQAVRWFSKSCDMGDMTGCVKLGGMYEAGMGVAIDNAKAVSLYRKGCDADVSSGCLGLGRVDFQSGNNAEAELVFRMALAMDEKTLGGNDPRLALDLCDLADLLIATGRFAEAEPLAERALTIDEAAGNQSGVATDLNNLGRIAQATGRPQDALPNYQKALDIYRQEKDVSGEANALNDMGSIYRSVDNAALAEEDLIEALQLFRQAGDLDGEASALGNLGLVYEGEGKLDQCEEYFQQALAILQRLNDPAEEAPVLASLARIRNAKGDYAGARQLLQQALAIDQKTLGPNAPATKQLQSSLDGLAGGQGKTAGK